MAEKVQVNTWMAADLRDAMRKACQERNLPQTDLIATAVREYLVPSEQNDAIEELRYYCQKIAADQEQKLSLFQEELRETKEAVCDILAILKMQQVKEEPPVATYAQMYGPIAPAPEPVVAPVTIAPPAPVRHSLWMRWLLRQEVG